MSGEDEENWSWFLRNLRQAIPSLANAQIPVFSDRDKGLLASVQEVFPGMTHAYCLRHLEANWKKLGGLSVDLKKLIWGCQNIEWH